MFTGGHTAKVLENDCREQLRNLVAIELCSIALKVIAGYAVAIEVL